MWLNDPVLALMPFLHREPLSVDDQVKVGKSTQNTFQLTDMSGWRVEHGIAGNGRGLFPAIGGNSGSTLRQERKVREQKELFAGNCRVVAKEKIVSRQGNKENFAIINFFKQKLSSPHFF